MPWYTWIWLSLTLICGLALGAALERGNRDDTDKEIFIRQYKHMQGGGIFCVRCGCMVGSEANTGHYRLCPECNLIILPDMLPDVSGIEVWDWTEVDNGEV